MLATWGEDLTHLKRNWCWERLRAGGEGDDRGWDGWMASPTRWIWVWVNSGTWWWTGRPGVLRYMGSQRVGHDWVIELNWGFNSMWTVNFQMFKLELEKAEEPGIKLPTSAGSSKKQPSSRKTSISALLTMPKLLTVWITINCGNSSRDGNTRSPDLPLEKSVCRSRSNS